MRFVRRSEGAVGLGGGESLNVVRADVVRVNSLLVHLVTGWLRGG